MYLCICNGLNETAIGEAARSGARTVRDAFRHHGHRPCCGKCVAAIRESLAEAGPGEATETPAAEADTGTAA